MRAGLRALAVVIATALSATALGGCAAMEPGAGDHVVASLPRPTTALLPAMADDTSALALAESIYGGLLDYAEDGSPVLDLASAITSTDAVHFEIELRPDAAFADGSPVTAASFVDAWNFAARASSAQTLRDLFSPILGYDAEQDSDLVAAGGLTVLDDARFEVTLGAPNADFPLRLGLVAFAPLPEAALDDPAAFARHPYGAGPYRLFGAVQSDETVQLVPNPHYSGVRESANAGVDVRFYPRPESAYADLLTGDVDVATAVPDSVRASSDEVLSRHQEASPIAVGYALAIPESLPHFGGAEGRQRRAAISRAIDRADIVARDYPGDRLPATGFVSPVVYGAQSLLLGSDATLADGLSAGILWQRGDQTSKWVRNEVPFTIAYDRDGTDAAALARLADQLSATLPMLVRLVPVDGEEAWRAGVADGSLPSAYLMTERAAYPSARALVDPLRAASDGTIAYQSDYFEDTLAQAARSASLSAASDLYAAAQQRLAQDLPVIPLWTGAASVAVGDRVDGQVRLDWRGVPRLWEIELRG